MWADEQALAPNAPGPIVAVYKGPPPHFFGILGAASDIPGHYAYVPDSPEWYKTSMHEVMHDLGFSHAGCTKSEVWPAAPQGSLIGHGIDRSLSGPGGLGPIYQTAALSGDYRDVMSYCPKTWVNRDRDAVSGRRGDRRCLGRRIAQPGGHGVSIQPRRS
jgi:hypothetical protein